MSKLQTASEQKSEEFQTGDILQMISGDKVLKGVYIDDGDVVYAVTLDVPDDVLFLRRFYYRLFPQLVTLGSLSDFEQVVLQLRSDVKESFKVAERAAVEVGSLTRLSNRDFVDYCNNIGRRVCLETVL
ncbi:hypothetical protein Bpfe_006936 [Biomphalaria pfeifferi]|uniref:Uncharacterized protein n=1 Tax=Biomphalaria pfeifferi TaxID=112525 RepID=A0AAD8FGS0_BIOPF|nr:hypothetical protein Bpfe_006936 [Biomphalaria pfeifferi]